MSRGFLLTVFCFAWYAVPSVVGSAILVPKLSTASCSGYFDDITITSVTCGEGNTDGECTYGSDVFVTGQITSNWYFPNPINIKVTRTLPSYYTFGTNVYNARVDDICDSGTLTPPDGEDSEYTCPSAGLYNFKFGYQHFGDPTKWYADWHGYSMGIAVHFKDGGGGKDFATCTINVKVKAGEDDTIATSATFVSVATLGLAGLLTGLFAKRRRERLAESEQSNHGERTNESATHFELVGDYSVVV